MKEGYYTSGEFAKMAQVTIRTIRYYDRQNILKPSAVTPAGARLYTDKDFARLQQILLLKYLGFSLESIREMLINDVDHRQLLDALNFQLGMIQERIGEMRRVEAALKETLDTLRVREKIDWSQMLDLIHLTGMEHTMKMQYLNSENLSARIRLHNRFSENRQGWFPWLYQNCRIRPGGRILELGCGDGSLWAENRPLIPDTVSITLTDISEGMLADAERKIQPDQGEKERGKFSFVMADCHHLPFPDHSFDLVIANHLLFYCDTGIVLPEIIRVLKPGAVLVSSTYSRNHMKEITQLVQDFDSRVWLSSEALYERFGKENGRRILEPFFRQVSWHQYEDRLLVTSAEPLISYILSCHGNQNQYLLSRYPDFSSYVRKKVRSGFPVTKDAGLFYCQAP